MNPQENVPKAKVLIVEDELSLLEAMKDELISQGFEVVMARNGEEGLRLALEQKPNLIILDILMPKTDGMTMLKNLRQEGEYGKGVKVIILTNLSADDKIISGVVETQPSYYLIKSDISIGGISTKAKEVLGVD